MQGIHQQHKRVRHRTAILLKGNKTLEALRQTLGLEVLKAYRRVCCQVPE
jgi:hypothetical protein